MGNYELSYNAANTEASYIPHALSRMYTNSKHVQTLCARCYCYACSVSKILILLLSIYGTACVRLSNSMLHTIDCEAISVYCIQILSAAF